jgi:hypothetical protein
MRVMVHCGCYWQGVKIFIKKITLAVMAQP